jgi:hypothetical protein
MGGAEQIWAGFVFLGGEVGTDMIIDLWGNKDFFETMLLFR